MKRNLKDLTQFGEMVMIRPCNARHTVDLTSPCSETVCRRQPWCPEDSIRRPPSTIRSPTTSTARSPQADKRRRETGNRRQPSLSRDGGWKTPEFWRDRAAAWLNGSCFLSAAVRRAENSLCGVGPLRSAEWRPDDANA